MTGYHRLSATGAAQPLETSWLDFATQLYALASRDSFVIGCFVIQYFQVWVALASNVCQCGGSSPLFSLADCTGQCHPVEMLGTTVIRHLFN